MFWNIVLGIVLNVAAYYLQPKQPDQKPKTIGDINVPSINEGENISVIFGTMEVSPFVHWFGDLKTKPIRAEGGKK